MEALFTLVASMVALATAIMTHVSEKQKAKPAPDSSKAKAQDADAKITAANEHAPGTPRGTLLRQWDVWFNIIVALGSILVMGLLLWRSRTRTNPTLADVAVIGLCVANIMSAHFSLLYAWLRHRGF